MVTFLHSRVSRADGLLTGQTVVLARPAHQDPRGRDRRLHNSAALNANQWFTLVHTTTTLTLMSSTLRPDAGPDRAEHRYRGTRDGGHCGSERRNASESASRPDPIQPDSTRLNPKRTAAAGIGRPYLPANAPRTPYLKMRVSPVQVRVSPLKERRSSERRFPFDRPVRPKCILNLARNAWAGHP
jgi:hypothetical protein